MAVAWLGALVGMLFELVVILILLVVISVELVAPHVELVALFWVTVVSFDVLKMSNVTLSRTCRTIQSNLSYYLVVLVVQKSYKSRTCRTSGRRFFTRSQFLKSSATSATTSPTTDDH